MTSVQNFSIKLARAIILVTPHVVQTMYTYAIAVKQTLWLPMIFIDCMIRSWYSRFGHSGDYPRLHDTIMIFKIWTFRRLCMPSNTIRYVTSFPCFWDWIQFVWIRWDMFGIVVSIFIKCSFGIVESIHLFFCVLWVV